jgi:hypothetical protein
MGVAGSIGVLLSVGSSGSGSVVATGANVTELRGHVNNKISQPFLNSLAPLRSTSLYILRPIKRNPPAKCGRMVTLTWQIVYVDRAANSDWL